MGVLLFHEETLSSFLKLSDQHCCKKESNSPGVIIYAKIERKTIPISLDLRIHSGRETPLGQALRAFLVCPKKNVAVQFAEAPHCSSILQI